MSKLITWWKYSPHWTKQLIILILGCFIFGVIYILGLYINPQGINEGLFTEFAGIFITVFLIGGLQSINSGNEAKKLLIRQAGSSSNDIAKAAMDELRKTGLIELGILRGADLSGANLVGASLKKFDLTGVNLKGAILNGADLSEAVLRDANLEGTKFEGAELNNADLSGCNFMGTNFSKAKLQRVIFNSIGLTNKISNFSHATFTEADLSFVDFTTLETIKATSFIKAILRNCIMDKLDISKCNFSGANLSDANLSDANLSEVNLSNADLREAVLDRANLSKSNLTKCDFVQAHLSDANLSEVNLSNADLREAVLDRANLSKSNLTKCDFFQAHLSDANLSEVNLSNADLREAVLDRANCRNMIIKSTIYGGSRFHKTILYGANFTESLLGDLNEYAEFWGVKFDLETVLPNGRYWDQHISAEILLNEFGMKITKTNEISRTFHVDDEED